MARKGILLDESTGDLLITPIKVNGLIMQGLVVGVTDAQNVDMIVSMAKGESKEYPVIGVGIVTYLKSVGRERDMIREIKLQLAMDGYDKATVKYELGQLSIDI